MLGCFSAFGSFETKKILIVETASESNARDAVFVLGEPGKNYDLANSSVEHEASALEMMVDWREPYPHDRSTNEYRDLVWSQIRAVPPEIRSHHDPGVDGDWAYSESDQNI